MNLAGIFCEEDGGWDLWEFLCGVFVVKDNGRGEERLCGAVWWIFLCLFLLV